MTANGIVLAGAAALGAYEVGVVAHVCEVVLPQLPPRPWVLSGSSAGAINAAAIAAFVDAPLHASRLLARAWGGLELARVLRPSSLELMMMLLDVAGVPPSPRALRAFAIRGGLLDAAPIAQLLEPVPFERIATHVASGRLRALTISATRVADGAAVVFFETDGATPWRTEPNVVPVPVQVGREHVMASAAIPLVFPPVSLAGDAYCDGGLRQTVPLSPAVHLGASRLLVVNPLPAIRGTRAPSATPSSPLFLAGKALNALFADRIAVDLAQLARTSAILRAGRRRYGPGFGEALSHELVADGGGPLHEVDALCIEPSHDLGVLAADHVAGRGFAARARGPIAHLLRAIAGRDPDRAGDLLAYLLFDGPYTSALIELGREDARRREEEIARLFDAQVASEVAV